METLQFILIGILIASNVLLFFKSYYVNKTVKLLRDMIDVEATSNSDFISKINERLDQLFNTIDTQVTSNDEFRKELMNQFENFIRDFKVYKKVHDLVSDRHSKDIEEMQSRFDKVETRFIQSNVELNNYAIANDMELVKIMGKINTIESEQVELSHSFDTMLASLAEVKTAEFLDNLGYSHESE